MKKISFVAHGKHINKHKIITEADKYFSNKYEVEFLTTTSGREAEALAEKAVINGTDYVIAIGGDGTLHEVINGVMRIPKENRTKLVLGLLPVGSGNDFARTFKISKRISDLYTLIEAGSIIQIDIGKIECASLSDQKEIHHFINIADSGLGAEVAKRVNEGNKTYGPNIAFFMATIKSFIAHKKKKIKFISGQLNYEGEVLMLVLANAKYFGSGLGIAPHADLNDGKIAVTLVGNVSLFDYLINVFNLRGCSPINHPQIFYSQAESCIAEPIGEPCLIEADGEVIGKLPLKAEMLVREVNFLASV